MPKLSAELFTVPLPEANDKYIVYAPLRQAAFVANTSAVNFIADLQEEIIDKQADLDGSFIELLRRLEIVDGGDEVRPVTEFHGDPEPTDITLFLTTACNLRCTYCYASAGDMPLRNMTFDIAKKGIDFILKNAIKKGVKHIEVNYHGGGEPTVNWKVMTESLYYAQAVASEHNIRVVSSCASNGVLNDKQIDWIVENLNGVSLSFDGLPEVHDRNRPTVGGKGSSEKAIHTMHRFDEAEFPYGVRVTVTHDQIEYLSDSVAFICSQFRPQNIQVEPAYQMGRWKEAPSAETASFIEAYRSAQYIARQHGKEIAFSGARLGMLSNHFCGVTQDSFCLTTEGKVSGCYETFMDENEWSKTFFYGTPTPNNEGYSFDLPVLNHLRQQAVQHREFCKGCFAKWTCGGDCYHKSLTVNGETEFQGTDRCHIIRELTKDQILQKIALSGGFFWHEELPTISESAAKGKELLIGKF